MIFCSYTRIDNNSNFIVDAFEIKEQKDQAKKALLNLTAQVVHDIRSPLAAITTAVSDMDSLPESKRVMIRNAAKRINDIANNLLVQSKNDFLEPKINGFDKCNYPELIFLVLDNIVAEKRYEYYKTNVNISLDVSPGSYNCFSNINPVSFKRVLSNLINNSIEAVNSNGSVTIFLACNANYVEIIIKDNGCGIPAEILPKVTDHGFSFNKSNGAGIGLSYAKQYLEQIGGKLRIHSVERIGTRISIDLVRCSHPNWFCDTLSIRSDSIIVILDDDPSIHDLWDELLGNCLNAKIVHHYNAFELYKYKIDSPASVPMLYLVDHELIKDIKTGLDIIEELQLNDNAILVTSCFEDIAIRNRCDNLGVKMIPKPYVPHIRIDNIRIKNDSITDRTDIVYIDDDEMMRMAWHFAAEEAEKTIITYSSFDDFISELSNYNKDNTIIYIDSELADNIRGEHCAKNLFDEGFTEIYLATGHSKNKFGYMPWIKSIVGKQPPFN